VLTPDVCVAVLQKKYSGEFPATTDWNGAVRTLVAGVLGQLANGGSAAPAPKPAAPQPPAAASDDDDDSSDEDASSDEDSDESDGEAGASYNSEEDEDAESGEETDEEDDEEDSESDDEEEAAEAEAALKKSRAEAADSSDQHTLEMFKFARKAGFSPRAIGEQEAVAAYRSGYLDEYFTKHGLDAADLSKAALKRAKMKAELAVLQQEADVALDRRARKGRAQFGADAPPKPAAPAFTSDTGLFDDE